MRECACTSLHRLLSVTFQNISILKYHTGLGAVVKVDRRIRWHYTTPILRLRIGARGIEIVNFTTAALSAGTLMASAGTPYRLVPADFYPCLGVYCKS